MIILRVGQISGAFFALIADKIRNAYLVRKQKGNQFSLQLLVTDKGQEE